MTVVDDAAILAACERKKEYILSNLENITMKAFRKDIEAELGLESGSLKEQKGVITAFVDKLLAASKAAKEGATATEKSRSPSIKKTSPIKVAKKAPATAAKTKASGTANNKYSAKVEKLRKLCKQATINVPTSLYVKYKKDADMGALEKSILALLEKQGLSAKSGKDDVALVKEKLQLAREMDGIDTSNIIKSPEGTGRRSRRRAAAAAVMNFSQSQKSESDDDGVDDERGVAGREDGTPETSEASASDDDFVIEDSALDDVSPAPRKKSRVVIDDEDDDEDNEGDDVDDDDDDDDDDQDKAAYEKDGDDGDDGDDDAEVGLKH